MWFSWKSFLSLVFVDNIKKLNRIRGHAVANVNTNVNTNVNKNVWKYAEKATITQLFQDTAEGSKDTK